MRQRPSPASSPHPALLPPHEPGLASQASLTAGLTAVLPPCSRRAHLTGRVSLAFPRLS